MYPRTTMCGKQVSITPLSVLRKCSRQSTFTTCISVSSVAPMRACRFCGFFDSRDFRGVRLLFESSFMGESILDGDAKLGDASVRVGLDTAPLLLSLASWLLLGVALLRCTFLRRRGCTSSSSTTSHFFSSTSASSPPSSSPRFRLLSVSATRASTVLTSATSVVSVTDGAARTSFTPSPPSTAAASTSSVPSMASASVTRASAASVSASASATSAFTASAQSSSATGAGDGAITGMRSSSSSEQLELSVPSACGPAAWRSSSSVSSGKRALLRRMLLLDGCMLLVY